MLARLQKFEELYKKELISFIEKKPDKELGYRLLGESLNRYFGSTKVSLFGEDWTRRELINKAMRIKKD